ncbi:DUF3617 domain-containing protein [Novosphingobium sp. Gsoil 351]|uniref:DUF3617 domain-containing protein n=1 Tax=Novosphingobium sp. Gsoil 351 TaxID=2675225 RepID=UPI0018A86F3C|nr:DUF3617 domain-containing protein [Novosphingobium sp. Gsoil 351]
MIRSFTLPSLALAVLALGACDKADKGPKSMEQAKAEAAQLERPDPGQYKQTTKITKFEVPGAPPEMVAQIRKMMQGQGANLEYCLSKADTEKGFAEMFKKGAQGDCKYDRFDASANTIDAIMTCKAGEGGSAKMTMNGTVSRTGSKVNVNVEQRNDKSPMGNANIAMELETTRIGDCPAGPAKK